ncbi:MAG: hypothetical protein BGO70_08575 [Bacteroidetes bacterium 43-93]|nr:PKD domain-containing protein [Bacteroidota bacterium]OJW97818.1 MAG: hypothetical protein BGO70_08575 [Bacteroidetes bacterium 43-93]
MNRYIHAILCITFSTIFSVAAFAQAPVANFSANVTTGCSPIVTNFTDLSTNSPTSWYWDLGNGTTSTLQNPSTTYFTAGTYAVKLVVTNASGRDSVTKTNYITVAPTPIVSFTADSTPSCTLPRTVTFSNTSSPGGSGTTTYLWDFGDGTTSTAQNPSKTYTTGGNYTITLLVTNGNGCSQSLTKINYIKVSTKPTADFAANNTNFCAAPATVAFTNNSGSGVSYTWDFGDGNTSTNTSPSNTYNALGSYNVRLITTNAAGCKDTMTKSSYINISHPTAAFNTSASTICSGRTIYFTNTSSPSGYTSAWDFGDNTTSTAANPSKSYTTAGTYSVRLIITKNGCKDTVYHTVTINQSPRANFSASPSVGCSAPFSTTFTNASTGGSSYYWTFGDGNTSTSTAPSHTYTALGNYNITLAATASNGCSDTAIGNNFIHVQTPTATITKRSFSGCVPVTVTFDATITTLQPVTSITWDFGDASSNVTCASCSTQSHTYTTAGTYTVTMSYTTGTGCNFSAQTTVTIASKPTAAFTASPLTICPGDSVRFTNGSTGANSYTWYFGNGATSNATNPVYTGYSYPGGSSQYSVTLVANNNGCKDTVTRNNYITVHPPLANFGVVYSCSNRRSVTIVDSSLGADTYSWNWGDGNTSTQTGGTLTHTYSSYGSYTITLNVSNNTYGCNSSWSRTINLQPLTPTFNADTTNCANTFFLMSAGASSNIKSYYWDLGNGISFTDTASSFYTQYNNGGIYTVKLVVTDANGCKDSLTKTNYMHVGGATVSFSGTPRVGCLPLHVAFTDNSTPNGGFAIVSRSWNFGYGADVVTTADTISKDYIYGGTWSVALKVTDANGCVSTLTRPNYITASKPVAQFYTNDTVVCAGQQVTIHNNSGGNNFTCVWYWGDGSTSTQLTPTHTYATAGVYTIKLVITDTYGCMDSASHTGIVKVQSPAMNFTLSDTAANCPPLAVNFTNTSSSVSSYTWVFDNGSRSSLANPSTLFTYPGVYHVKLIGTSSAGCKDSVTKNVTVHGPTGTFSYSPLTGCLPLTVNFSATTNGASQLVWDMNNGYTHTTTGSTYSYTYTQTGKYIPKLILSDGANCLVPVQGLDTVKVDHTDGDFTFTPSNNCGTSTVQFRDTILSTLSPVTGLSWNFGDGNTSTSHNPTHTYNAAGNYTVRFIATNSQGCQDTTIKTIVVHPLPNVTAGNAQSACQGYTTALTVTAAGARSYTWTPTTGMSCDTCATTTVMPTSTTTYIVTGIDTNGCSDTGKVTITVNPKPNVTASANVTICDGASATLTGYGATSYTWSPATSLSCTSCISTTATPSATTTYIVTGTDGNGCTDTGMVNVTVNPKPTVTATGTQTICAGSAASLNASGATTYSWSPATGLSCTTCANPVASPTATTTYTVTGTNSTGCTNTATVTITVNPKPTVSAGSNVAICAGNSTTLTATGAASYTWSPSTGLSCSNCASPVANPATTTTYTVTGTNASGCSNTATVTVTVNSLPNVTASSNVTICDGTSTTLTGSGASSYTWSPSTGLSCASCTSPSANPSTTTTYIVTGTDGNGCTDTGIVTVTVNPKPLVTASASQAAICAGGSSTLTAAGASTYSWSPATGLSCTSCASPVATPTATTTYTVTGTNSNGCTNTATVTVTVNPLPTIGLTAPVTICNGSNTTLTATGAASYTWSPATGLSCANCASPVANPAATTTYVVTGTDAKGCINTASVKVTVNPLPDVTATGSKTICPGETAALSATGANSYAWSPATGLSCTTCPNPNASPAATTTYVVTGTTNGCSATASVTVTVRPLPNITAGPDKEICTGASTSLMATGGATYAWSPSTGLSCANCANPNANPSATTKYTITGTDANGCVNTANITVTVNPLPNIDAGEDKTICNGSSTTLNATGGVSYTWSGGSQLSCISCANPTVSPTTKTSYTVRGTDAHGCSNKDSVTISVIDKGPIEVGPGAEICKGESAVLHAAGGSSYLWTPAEGLNDPTSANPVATPDKTTTYRVQVQQGDCFAESHDVVVIVHDLPEVELGPDVNLGGGNTVQLNAKTNQQVTYVWTPTDHLSCADCQSPQASPFKTTTYTVVATNQWGCQAKDDITVHVSCDGSQIFLANTFTPNGDGVNDQFFPQGKGIMTVKSFKIYNRWGELMFSRDDMPLNDPMVGWDGTYKNAPLKPDVYVYIVKAYCESGEPIELKGDISLIR